MSGVHSIAVPSKPVDRSQGHTPGASAKPKSIQKAIIIYTHLLDRDRWVFAALWTGFEAITRRLSVVSRVLT